MARPRPIHFIKGPFGEWPLRSDGAQGVSPGRRIEDLRQRKFSAPGPSGYDEITEFGGLNRIPRDRIVGGIMDHRIKGKGVSFSEGKFEWHSKVGTSGELEFTRREFQVEEVTK